MWYNPLTVNYVRQYNSDMHRHNSTLRYAVTVTDKPFDETC
jgi:hypothetical protein